MIDIIDLEQYEELIKKYTNNKNTFYRGQSDSTFPNISASINRDEGFKRNEYKLIFETLQIREKEFSGLKNPIEQLSKMQHYGIPTRLIDITVDPYIALFFAIENVNELQDGEVFVFIKECYQLEDKPTKLLSLISKLNNFEAEFIKSQYQAEYNESISEKDIFKYINQNAFVKFHSELAETNDRLYNQKGTFVICGNNIVNDSIVREIKNIEKIEAQNIIRIPYEHKKHIKQQLELKYGLNESYIYPELPSFANYLKEKYTESNFRIDNCYSIVEDNDINFAHIKRKSITILLEKRLTREAIEKIVIEVIDKYRINLDVIWLYVANKSTDLIIRNWIVRAQWIREQLEERWRPAVIGEIKNRGIIWDFSRDFKHLNEYFEENVFKDDKTLFIDNQNLLKKVEEIFNKLSFLFQSKNFGILKNEIIDYKDRLQVITEATHEFGRSRNIEFDLYLANSKKLIYKIHDFINDVLSVKNKVWIKDNLEKIRQYLIYIQQETTRWKKELQIIQEDYRQISFSKLDNEEWGFKPKIPLNNDGLKVDFHIKIIKSNDNKFRVFGETNLYNEAVLLLTIRNEQGITCGQDKVEVKNNKFRSDVFSMKGIGYDEGHYTLVVSLSIPSTQAGHFVAVAGSEYENLKGQFVKRDGLGPSVEYLHTFFI
ncbi:FRG domain-containing protein [Bacillus cereus]|uniref:FRG domain-containing protein n=1 Tax=Bacillus cereus TaxID=1396 RepID=UPI0035C965DA